jgi:hypothetical protein
MVEPDPIRGGMNMTSEIGEQYATFLRLMGHRVVQTRSSIWIDIRPRIFQPAPPFNLPHIEKDEARSVLRQTNAIGCRWFARTQASSESEAVTGTTLYLAREPYDVAHLPHSARHQTRRGLERVEVRRQKLDEALEPLAFVVYSDTMKRLGLLGTDAQIGRKWKTWVKAIRESCGLDFWAAWHEGQMVAFAVTIDTPLGKEFVLTRSLQAALSLYPNNALIYTITKDALDHGAPLVSLGLSAFAGEKPGLRHFKINMGYEAVILKENHVWHPLMRPFGPVFNPARLRAMYRLVSRTTS